MEIKRVWAEAGANTLELAKVVHAARNQVRRGEWTELWRCGHKLPFSRRKAQYLLVIRAGLGWATVHTRVRICPAAGASFTTWPD